MKKTFTISISGTVFHIEEDAYEKLQGYLTKLKTHFGNDEEGREIVADIETRICELFFEKTKGDNKVVVSEWVDEVIATMGTPQDFIDQESPGKPLPGSVKGKRRLYRDIDNKVIGGVCSGLGAYFNIDPTIIRIIMVVLFLAYGVGFWAYILLWIAVPRAQTTTQRLEMRGKEVNVTNIEKTIREDVPEDKSQAQNLTDTGTVAQKKSKPMKTSDPVSDVFKGLMKAVVIALGIFMILIGFMGLLGFISSLVIGQTFLSDWPLALDSDLQVSGLFGQFVSGHTIAWGLLCIGLLAGIPLLALLYIGTKLVFGYKSNNAAIGLGMVGVWLLALIALFVVTTSELRNFRGNTSLTSSETLYFPVSKAVKLTLADDRYANYNEMDMDFERIKMVAVDGKSLLLGEPRLDIEKSSTNDCVIVIKKQSRGKTQQDANENIRDIIYNYEVRDSTLFFDPWFLLGENSKWRNQKVDVILKIPEGMAVYLDENIDGILYNVDNVSNTWDREMGGKTWVMQPEGLTMKDSLEVRVF